MKKATLVEYNPFANSVNIKITSDINDLEWEELSDKSELRQYTNPGMKVLFSNIAADVVRVINEKQNSSEDGLEILFYGPLSDYEILRKLVEEADFQNQDKGKLSCRHMGFYKSADESIQTVKNAYSRIAKEFDDYLPGKPQYTGNEKIIGDHINDFKKIIKNDIPICVIGNYSVGKSAFINALIGNEILPSDVNASTAKNVKIACASDDKYYIKVDFQSDSVESISVFEYETVDGDIRIHSCLGHEEQADELLDEIKKAICEKANLPDLRSMHRIQLLHDFLDVLNNTESEGLISHVGWNVILTVPFTNSLLTKTDSTVVIYDTPGSNNASVKQEDHRKALEALMEEQTNALPIMMTTKENAASNDVLSIKNLLDKYSENFSAPNCLVLLSKSDSLVKSQLQSEVSTELKTWHGRSTILYVSPVAAIGIKKEKKQEWLDQDYRDHYKEWIRKYEEDPKSFTLPKYNIVPCQGRNLIDVQKKVSAELYASGIPSVEAEILYYIDNYANYKKASRGRETLNNALKEIESELILKKEKLSDAEDEAHKKKLAKKTMLLEDLSSIHIDDLTNEADAIANRYASELDVYIEALPQVLNELYDQVIESNPLDIDKALNEQFKVHCQMNLIDRCYSGKGGIREEIIQRANEYARNYMNDLSSFVSNNENMLSEEGRINIHNYLTTNIQPPELKDVESILDVFNEWIEKAAMIEYGFRTLAKDKENAKERWLDTKQRAYEKRLRDGKTILNKPSYGLFKRTAVCNPLKNYANQLNEWADRYQKEISNRLDSENAILSGMEDEIKQINDSIRDISDRLDNLADVKKHLNTLTEKSLFE